MSNKVLNTYVNHDVLSNFIKGKVCWNSGCYAMRVRPWIKREYMWRGILWHDQTPLLSVSLCLSRPDVREPFYSLFWLGQGVTRVHTLVFLFLCWPGMVPNQRQLSIVVSDWGYLGSLFPPVWCGILILYCCFLALQSCMFVLLLFICFVAGSH